MTAAECLSGRLWVCVGPYNVDALGHVTVFSFWSSLGAGEGALQGCGLISHAHSVTPVLRCPVKPQVTRLDL